MVSLFFWSHLFPLQYLKKSDKHQGIHNVLEASQMVTERTKRTFFEAIKLDLLGMFSILFTLIQDKRSIKGCK